MFIEKSEWGKFGDYKRLPSGESIIYLDESCKTVTKIRNPFAKDALKNLHAQDIIYEHLVHNILFPATRYRLTGVSEDYGEIRLIYSQAYIADNFNIPTDRIIDEYMTRGLGLSPEDRYYYGNEYVAITDVSAASDNVLFDGEKLFFIDPIIKMKKPATEILAHYYKIMK